jgi:hypothetical protein
VEFNARLFRLFRFGPGRCTTSALSSSSAPPERAELKSLHGAPGGRVIVSPRIDQMKIRTQQRSQRSSIMPHDRQSAASPSRAFAA